MKSGFVAMIGRPNAGKSTLLNQILDRKIAIVSDKPQTTRNRITGIYTTDEVQIVFVDTPGIHKPKHKLGEYMVDTAEKTADDVDVIYYLVDASVSFGKGEQYVLEQLKESAVPVFLLLNKTDKLSPEEIGKVIISWQERGEFAEVFPLSALKGDNVSELVKVTEKYLPEGPLYYPADAVTDQPVEIVISELIREKILELTHDEINACIYVERSSQKGIIIGKNGAMLKKVGIEARKDIEYLLAEKVNLKLWVKVREDWRNKRQILANLGYNEL